MRYKFHGKEYEDLSEALNELHNFWFDTGAKIGDECHFCPLNGLRCDLWSCDIPDEGKKRLLQLAHIEVIPDEGSVIDGLAPKGPAQGGDCKAECKCKCESEIRGKRSELPIIEEANKSEPFMRKNLYLGVNFNLAWEVGDPTEAGHYLCICGVLDKGRVSDYIYNFVYFNPDFGWDFYEGDGLIVCAWADKIAKPTTEDIIYGGTIGE